MKLAVGVGTKVSRGYGRGVKRPETAPGLVPLWNFAATGTLRKMRRTLVGAMQDIRVYIDKLHSDAEALRDNLRNGIQPREAKGFHCLGRNPPQIGERSGADRSRKSRLGRRARKVFRSVYSAAQRARRKASFRSRKWRSSNGSQNDNRNG